MRTSQSGRNRRTQVHVWVEEEFFAETIRGRLASKWETEERHVSDRLMAVDDPVRVQLTDRTDREKDWIETIQIDHLYELWSGKSRSVTRQPHHLSNASDVIQSHQSRLDQREATLSSERVGALGNPIKRARREDDPGRTEFDPADLKKDWIDTIQVDHQNISLSKL